MTDSTPEVYLVTGAELPLAPSEEDWGVLIGGHASPWLRQHLLDYALSDPESAERLRSLTDPAYQTAIEEAGALKREPLTTPAQIRTLEGGSSLSRQVKLRLRPQLTTLFVGVSCLTLSVLADPHFRAILIVGSLVAFLYFAIELYNSHPRVQAERARAAGDNALAEAIEQEMRKAAGS